MQKKTGDKMREFGRYHPAVNFIYFLMVIGFSMFLMHPIALGISLVCGMGYFVLQKGRRGVRIILVYMLPFMLITAGINPAFNHAGVTVIGYFPSGNPLTLESVLYGIAASAMLFSVICWFFGYNAVMTSDKFIYLFGRIIPALSLVLSMTLRFVPKFSAQLKVVVNAQKCLGKNPSRGNLFKRIRYGLNILSIMTTWALENAVETADSMKSRGYGIPGRTTFSLFVWSRRDLLALGYLLFLGIYIGLGCALGKLSFAFFPMLKGSEVSVFGISVWMAYFLLCTFPMMIEIREARKWNALKSKI